MRGGPERGRGQSGVATRMQMKPPGCLTSESRGIGGAAVMRSPRAGVRGCILH